MTDTNRALLFDMDGTLIDSDPLHFRAFEALLGEYGRQISKAEYDRDISGHSNAEVCLQLFPDMPISEHQAFADRKEAHYRELARDMQPVAGIVPLLDHAKQAGYKLAVVTNAPRANLIHILDVLGLESYFDAVVVGEELPRAKPDPLPYLTALDILDGRPEHALAFEDSIPGMTAARGAGLRVVGISTTMSAEKMIENGALLAAGDFNDAGLWEAVKGLCG